MRIISLFFALLFLAACKPNRVYEEHRGVADLKWERSDVKAFEFEIPDTNVHYKMYAAIRYIQGFPFKDLNVQVELSSPAGKKIQRDLQITIRNSAGYIGDGAGDYWDLEYLFDKDFTFEEAGKYQLEIKHQMTNDPVVLVNEVGFVLEKIEK